MQTTNPVYTRGEAMADRCVHLVGLPAGVAGAVSVVVVAALRHGPAELLGILIYALSLVAMLSLSAAYNLARRVRAKEILRPLDHSAIFLMIAGTYTPFVPLVLKGWAATGFYAFIWTAAAGGVAVKLLFPRRFERASLAFYLLLGWSGVIIAGPLLSTLKTSVLLLLLAGGILYTIGTGFHTARRLRFHNAIWHALVLAGAGLHYAAVFDVAAGSG